MSIKEVIAKDFCIGCGACSSVVKRIAIDFNVHGDLVAKLPPDITDAELHLAGSVCPFAGGDDESQIAQRVFGSTEVASHAEIGLYRGLFAGYAPSTRARGSSGGVATWLLESLLQSGRIDYAVHVSASSDRRDARFFAFSVSATAEQVRQGATSFYYPVSMDEVLEVVRNQPGRYAVTGIPCFQKALRQLRAIDPVLDERIAFQIGIVCGQMKSAHYLEYLIQQAGATGVPSSACFRRKVPGRPADDYAFEATFASAPGESRAYSVLNSKIGVNWGMGYFKPNACDYCDDVFAETADVAVMDAWRPEYVSDGDGWSFIVTRNLELHEWVKRATESANLVTRPADAESVSASQRGGLNHRRETLPFRLWLSRKQWHPRKRLAPSSQLGVLLKLEQHLRMHLRHRSRSVWRQVRERGGLPAFRRKMWISEFAYRVLSKLKRMLR